MAKSLLANLFGSGVEPRRSGNTGVVYVYSSRDAALLQCIYAVEGATTETSLAGHLVAGRPGTGGTISTLEHLASQLEVAPEVRARGVVRSPVAEMVSDIRASLSLRMTELARILDVERPTVYAWLRSESTPLESNQRRLREVWELARWWRGTSVAAVGNAIRQADPDLGRSILDLLAEQPLPVDSVKSALAGLSDGGVSTAGVHTRPAEFASRHSQDGLAHRDQADKLDSEVGLGADLW